MQRGLVTICAAALLCAAGALTLGFFADRGVPLPGLVLFSAAATLLLSAVAAAFAAMAWLRSSALRTEFSRLSRSLDAAVRELAARDDRDAASIAELKGLVSKLASPAVTLPVADTPPASAEEPSNIVVLPPARRFRTEIVAALPPPSPAANDDSSLLAAIEAAMADRPDIALRPLVSVTRGETTGYEVVARIARRVGGGVEIGRLPADMPEATQAAFGRWLVTCAVDAARRNVAGNLPLHVPVSPAVLSSGRELAATVDVLNRARDSESAIALVLPALVFGGGSDHADAIGLLRTTGARLAAQDWLGSSGELEMLVASRVSAIRVGVDLLLLRTSHPALAAPPARMVEMAARRGLPLVATGIADEADAVAMLDLGVGEMTGPIFAARRRARSESLRDAAGA